MRSMRYTSASREAFLEHFTCCVMGAHGGK
jgi:hypothetical protein